jgi:subtilase family serine protease
MAVAPAAGTTRAFPLVRGTIDGGRAAATTPMHVVIGLRTTNRAAIDRILMRQATRGDVLYHRALSPAQARAMVAPSGARVEAVGEFLAKGGFANVRVTPDNLLVSGDADVAHVERAFSTEIHVMRAGTQHILANVRPAVMPAALRPYVSSIEGLHTYAMHTNAVVKPSVQECTEVPVLNECALSDNGPKDFQQVYDAGTLTAKNTKIAIIAEGLLTGVVSDLRQQETLSGLPAVPVTIVPTGAQSGDTSGSDEWDMDTQYSTGIATNVAQLYLYDAPSLDDGDITTEFDRFVTDDLAKAASASFGGCETLAEIDGEPATDDAIFSEAALQGQTIFASAGDTGTFCPAPVVSENGVPAGLPGQEYPASSPYIVAAGGTTMLANASGAYGSEIGWYSGGGGPSLIETAGAWQSAVAKAAVVTRDVPDVAMDADPNTGANVIVEGAAEEVGGTSLSSPLSLGVWAMLETANKNELTFAAPMLYKEYADLGGTSLTVPSGLTQPIGGFHDILIGANPLPAGPGYDFSTGLGTFDVGASAISITL